MSLSVAETALVRPHGGALVNRIVSGSEADALRSRAASLPRITLDAREQADLELIATGAASPLEGFLGPADVERVASFGCRRHVAATAGAGRRTTRPQARLSGTHGRRRLWGGSRSSTSSRGLLEESRKVYRTGGAPGARV
jgi:hypothetical protein